MRSKHFDISASRTHLGFLLIEIKIAFLASWQERPGLNPYELGSNLASHSGSRANLRRASRARYSIVGIPKPRFSLRFGFGIQTRLKDLPFLVRVRFSARLNRWLGLNSFTPSIPAVFLPWLSCEMRRTAMSLAHHPPLSPHFMGGKRGVEFVNFSHVTTMSALDKFVFGA